MPHRLLDHTADVRLEIEAPTRDELFAEALVAFSDTITEVESLDLGVERAFSLAADSLAELFVLWLEELLFVFDTESLLFGGAEVSVVDQPPAFRLRARARGELFSLERHPFKVQIKAITYHGLEVGPEAGSWRARVVLDL